MTDHSHEDGSLDLDHLAELANLPLDDAERERLREACRDVLEAFRLEDVEEEQAPAEPVRTFEDEARAWEDEEIEAILEQFPDRDGRELST